MTIEFELNGQPFTGLNGGPIFKFNEAVSFQVLCENQQESITTGTSFPKVATRTPSNAAGSKDKFGLSWQIVPTEMIEMLKDKDATKSQRVMTAVLQMRKIDIAKLREAYEQK